jgi:hypothetical protein
VKPLDELPVIPRRQVRPPDAPGEQNVAAYTNDPPGSSGTSGGSAGGSAGAVTVAGQTVIAAVSGTTTAGGSPAGGSTSGASTAGGSTGAAKAVVQLRMARLVKIHGHVYLVVRVASKSKSATIRIIERNARGQKVHVVTKTIATNRNVRLAIPLGTTVRVADVKLA